MIDPVTLSALGAALDAASLRQMAGAANIANANTAGYTPMRVRFEELMPSANAVLQRNGRLSQRDLSAPQLVPAAESSRVPVSYTHLPTGNLAPEHRSCRWEPSRR